MNDTDILVLGAGLSGLSAGAALGACATVLERDDRPGGLVRTERLGDYWFDRVIHLLYFPDERTETRICRLLGPDLAPCPATAWVECVGGTARFPLQLHLEGLDPDTRVDCLRDFAQASFSDSGEPPRHFEEMLRRTFGEALFRVFFGPYNRKMWKRPLDELAPSGFTWNICRPTLDQVLRGALGASSAARAYNANGWYPRPQAGAPVRGMEVLSRALARKVHDLRLEHEVVEIDLDARRVTALHRGRPESFHYRHACIATLPLPALLSICRPVPDELLRDLHLLTWNRVRSAVFAVRGPRPEGRGYWRYFTDETVVFNRLIYTCAFDPLAAPDDGWGVMAEITEPAEEPGEASEDLLRRARADLERVGALPRGCRVVDRQILLADPAYVVFSVHNQGVIERARSFLGAHDLLPTGRYGHWEYSSMAQVIRDGLAHGERIRAALPLEASRQAAHVDASW